MLGNSGVLFAVPLPESLFLSPSPTLSLSPSTPLLFSFLFQTPKCAKLWATEIITNVALLSKNTWNALPSLTKALDSWLMFITVIRISDPKERSTPMVFARITLSSFRRSGLVNTEACPSLPFFFCQPIYNNAAWFFVAPEHFRTKQPVVLFLNWCVVVVSFLLV